MSEPKYSVADIDRMRFAVAEALWPAPHDDRVVEERLRTYMLNGTTYQELEEQAEKKRAARERSTSWKREHFKPGGMHKDWQP